MAGLPPVARLAVVFVAGSALSHPGARLLAPLLVLLITAPIRASRRPGPRLIWLLAALAGVASGLAGHQGEERCDLRPRDGAPASVTGRLLAEGSRSLPFRVEAPAGCRTTIRVQGGDLELGRTVAIAGRWRAWAGGFTLQVEAVRPDTVSGWDAQALLIRWRGHLVRRLHALYPDRGGLVAGLVLARKEGLDPGVREAFARTGTAHLLAISGFHVGVVAALLLVALRWGGASRRRAGLLASVGAWAYVGFIGFPNAACRAALILTVVACSRLRGRPPARFGALAVALLILVVWEPQSIGNVGFQLSFAGAGSLVLWSSRIAGALHRWSGGRIPDGLRSALGAGLAATGGTLPVVAWHFERVSLVGVPATLVASPLVVLALPGALASLALDALSPSLGAFLAGGVDLLLQTLTLVTDWLARPGWASVWVTRSWVAAASVGGYLGLALLGGTRLRLRVRRALAVLAALGAVMAWPLIQGSDANGRLEILVLDVGQGDAVALRTPRGRWVLVDAGPPGRTSDAGAHPAVRALRRRGVSRLELLVLTHPDLDHIGGAAAVLTSFAVGGVLDPGLPAGKGPFVEVLKTAATMGVPWTVASEGQRFEIDGVTLEVMHPGPASAVSSSDLTANDASVILLVRYGAFDALLTGDAPASVERGIALELPTPIEVLKVSHHGSNTSTDSVLVRRALPRAALVSVGRGNRYGHPAPAVLQRLRRSGTELFRTDTQGTLRVQARSDGRFTVQAEAPPRR